MRLQSITDPKKAAEMGERIMQITVKGLGLNGCSIFLEDDQVIPNVRLVSINTGNNGGKGGQWSYYGIVTVVAEDNQSYMIDLSSIKDVT